MDIHKALSDKEMINWLNNKYRNTKAIAELNKKFKNHSPFSHIEMHDFLNPEKVKTILKALKKEEFLEKESDLFKFMQTHDFKTVDNKELKEFYHFLSSEAFITFIEAITELKISTKIDMSASLYQNTDFLLPHDDRLEKRKIAYMLYLTELKVNEGGKLLLYKTKAGHPSEPEEAITSKFNTFIIFKVSEKSFHEVEEVIANTQRITIGGWFHG